MYQGDDIGGDADGVADGNSDGSTANADESTIDANANESNHKLFAPQKDPASRQRMRVSS